MENGPWERFNAAECAHQDGRLILQRLRDQDAQVRRHPSPVARLVDAMRRWPSLDVARRLVAAAPPSPVALATLRPPAHSGARALFRWPEPEHWTRNPSFHPLTFCISNHYARIASPKG